MKKTLAICIITALLLSALGAVSVSAFGTGIEVAAKDVTMIKTGLSGQKMEFTDSDFKCALCIADFDNVTITKLPSSVDGTLLLAGRRVSEGQSIKRRSVAALSFIPASREVKNASFSFKIDGQAGNYELICQMKFIDKINQAPSIDDAVKTSLSLVTQSEISVFGELCASDPEGDQLVYIIVSYPKNGSLTFTDQSEGRYRYTPVKDFTGYDRFTYVARDIYGNYSEPEEVEIKVIKRTADISYRDMENRSEYNAAVAMSAMGVMNGKIIGDDCYFMPEDTLTKAEFVAMALKAYGIKPDGKLKESFFDDGSSIPSSLVGYVIAAEKRGIIDGTIEDGKLNLKPNESISVYEAATVMARLIGKSEADGQQNAELSDVPVWAKPSVYSMIESGILDEGLDYTANLTKGSAAELLYRMVNMK